VWKGDRVAACIAAASVVAKVTRDRLMVRLHEHWPVYDFATHKGYCTEAHQAALREHGACPEHRHSYVNVRSAAVVDNGRTMTEHSVSEHSVNEQRVTVTVPEACA
jgi:ribonuclease HII